LADPRLYPALDVRWSGIETRGVDDEATGRILAALDDGSVAAADDQSAGVLRLYFTRSEDRDRAADRLRASDPSLGLTPQLVSDESWAERSQASLAPVRVDRIVVAPPWSSSESIALASAGQAGPVVIVIHPSMGFGTGHHASTRLCLRLLQQYPVDGAEVLDVGTGSGVLAIAAARLGAARVFAIDSDPDALAAARENVKSDALGARVAFAAMDITREAGTLASRFDLVLGNLTGGMLRRTAPLLVRCVRAGGQLIVSGFQDAETSEVRTAFSQAGATLVGEAVEEGWGADAYAVRHTQ
jgi:ribosomal protein L11 methyltransferase